VSLNRHRISQLIDHVTEFWPRIKSWDNFHWISEIPVIKAHVTARGRFLLHLWQTFMLQLAWKCWVITIQLN